MAEAKKRKRKTAPGAAARPKPAAPPPEPAAPREAEATAEQRAAGDDTERSLGRWVALGLPAASLVGAVAVGLLSNLGSALLVLAAGGLLGAIAFFWASVRTLTGDAPLPTNLAAAVSTQRAGVDSLADRKRAALRALKDLEAEHAIGKIDDADYQVLVAQYREDAKAVLRLMDERLSPAREEAERIAKAYLEGRGLGSLDGGSNGAAEAAEAAGAADAEAEPGESRAASEPDEPAAAPARVACPGCDTSNEPDAAFCKKCGKSLKPTAEAKDAEA